MEFVRNRLMGRPGSLVEHCVSCNTTVFIHPKNDQGMIVTDQEGKGPVKCWVNCPGCRNPIDLTDHLETFIAATL